MAKGVFGSKFAFSEMLTRATPLMFTGLAAALAFRAKLWNIGAEGQLYLGAMAAVAIGTGFVEAPGFILVPLIIAFGCAAGSAVDSLFWFAARYYWSLWIFALGKKDETVWNGLY